MSKFRVVNGTIEDMQKVGDEVIERRSRARIDTGCLSDPAGLVAAAQGRFEQIPDRTYTNEDGTTQTAVDRAKKMIKLHQVEDARFRVPGEPDLDLVIVLFPKPKKVRGVNNEDILVDRYIVFLRRCLGTVAGTCYRCDNHDKKGLRDEDGKKVPAPAHDNCWRRKTWDEWVPQSFVEAHGIDDAEDIAKEMRSALSAESEQEQGGTEYGAELPFSSDWLAGYSAAKGRAAWTSNDKD